MVKKDLVAGVYDRASALYERGPMSRFGERLVELMDIQTGASVLDVGFGRGENLFPAAERVGLDGRVVGIDISEGMLSEVDAAIKTRDLAQASVQHMDGETLEFADASFDYLLCGYTVFWFSDLVQALRGFRRVLTPDGSVGISMSGGGDPRWAWYGELLGEYGKKEVKFSNLGDNKVNGKPDILNGALLAAGFKDVRIIVEPFEIVYTSAEEWWEEKWAHGSRVPLEQMTPDVLARFKTDAFTKLAGMEEDDVYRMEWKTCFATAENE